MQLDVLRALSVRLREQHLPIFSFDEALLKTFHTVPRRLSRLFLVHLLTKSDWWCHRDVLIRLHRQMSLA